MSEQVERTKVTTKGNVFQKLRDTETGDTRYRRIDPGTGETETVVQQAYAAASGWHRPLPRITRENVEDIDPSTQIPVQDVARKDSRGRWHAGSAENLEPLKQMYPEVKPGQLLTSDTARDLRTFRRELQAYKQVYRNYNPNYLEGEINKTKDEVLQIYKDTVMDLQRAETDEERNRLREENFYPQRQTTPA